MSTASYIIAKTDTITKPTYAIFFFWTESNFFRAKIEMVVKFSKSAFLALSTTLAGNWKDEKVCRMGHSAQLEIFNDRFYASPKTIKQIFRDIQHPGLGKHCIQKPDPRIFLSAFYFLKKYPTKSEQGGFAGLSGKHGLKKAWKYVFAIQALKEKKIKWIFDDMPYADLDEYFFLSVDGVHCRIYEPRFMPSSTWYSPKFNKAGLAYEIGLSVYHDKICWCSGPYPAGQNDLRIFRKPDGLMSKIPENSRVVADEGYVGEPTKVATRNGFDSPDIIDLKRRSKARQESINSKLKSFGILSGPFRTTGKQRMFKHQASFEACLVIIQYELDNGSRKLMKV